MAYPENLDLSPYSIQFALVDGVVTVHDAVYSTPLTDTEIESLKQWLTAHQHARRAAPYRAKPERLPELVNMHYDESGCLQITDPGKPWGHQPAPVDPECRA